MEPKPELTGSPPPTPGSPDERAMPVEQAIRLHQLAESDLTGLAQGYRKYGDSWRKRGGGEAYHNLTRKWDRIERAVEALATQDVFAAIKEHPATDGTLDGKDSLLDDIRDLRRYLYLVDEFVTRST